MCSRVKTVIQDYVLGHIVRSAGLEYTGLRAAVDSLYYVPPGDARELRGILQGMRERCAPEDMIIESEYLEAAAGGKRALNYGDLVVSHALADWACSSFTLWGDAAEGSGTLHARNLDWAVDPAGVLLNQQMLKIYRSDEDKYATWASVSIPGFIGCISCFNREGTGLTIHNSNGLQPTGLGAVPRMLTSRAAVVAAYGNEDKVAAIEGLLTVRPKQSGDNYHVTMHCDDSDPTCTGAVAFEYDGNGLHPDGYVTVRRPDDVEYGLNTDHGFVVTNHYLKRRSVDDLPDNDPGRSEDRFMGLVQGINSALTTGAIDINTARQIILGTSRPFTVLTTLSETGTNTLHVHVSEPDNPAPGTTGHEFDLAALFAELPALPGE